ncbi:MAG TPA: GGDEF domain-containing protein [Acidimicrobiales bacterium]|nr:GGDEF domain-containing protein [Acidimicrobiales bacterium]
MASDRAHRHRPSTSLDAFVALGTAVAGLVAAAAAGLGGLPSPGGYWLATVAMLVALDVAGGLPLRGRVLSFFDLAETGIVFGAALLAPADALTALAAAALLCALFQRGCSHKRCFAWANIALSGTVAIAVANGPLDMGDQRSSVRLLLAALAYGTVSFALTRVAMRLAGQRPDAVVRALPLLAYNTGLAATIGILAAALAPTPWLLPLLAVLVAAVTFVGLAADSLHLEKRRELVLLGVARSAGEPDDVAVVIRRMVEAAARLTGGAVRLAAAPPPPPAISVRLPAVFRPMTYLVAEPPPHEPTRGEPEPTRDLETLVAISATAAQNAELRARLQEQATTDDLTGLGNERFFRARLDLAVSRARRGRPFGLLFVDLDRFKTVNDTLGHDTGDQLLCEVAARLRDAVRDVDEVFRLHGDEFTVIVDGVGDEDALAVVGAALRSAVAAPVRCPGGEVSVGASVGGVVWWPGADVRALLREADDRMYAAKPAGR